VSNEVCVMTNFNAVPMRYMHNTQNVMHQEVLLPDVKA